MWHHAVTALRRSDMNSVLIEMFRHNQWANLRLIDVCAGLPDEVLETHAVGTFGTIRDTIGHLAGAEEGYLAALLGSAHIEMRPTLATLREDAIAAGRVLDLATVREHARISGDGLIAYVERIEGNPAVRVTWGDQVFELSAALYLVQAINHATQHRVQTMTALTQAGIPPPDLDGWTWNSERANDYGKEV
jgi:uncharacterized damage-inducible protein DinB